MAYTIDNLCEHFAKNGKPIARSTLYRRIARGIIPKPDIGADGKAHPLWFKLPYEVK